MNGLKLSKKKMEHSMATQLLFLVVFSQAIIANVECKPFFDKQITELNKNNLEKVDDKNLNLVNYDNYPVRFL